MGKKAPAFIYDYPTSQAMLAKVRQKQHHPTSRFEVYYKGIKLANGFHELNDPKEQRKRFKEDLLKRKKLQLPLVPMDEDFLSALPKLSNCSGVAIGIDRLLLLAINVKSLNEVLF